MSGNCCMLLGSMRAAGSACLSCSVSLYRAMLCYAVPCCAPDAALTLRSWLSVLLRGWLRVVAPSSVLACCQHGTAPAPCPSPRDITLGLRWGCGVICSFTNIPSMLCRDLYELDWERRGRQALLDIFSTMTMQQVSSSVWSRWGWAGVCSKCVCCAAVGGWRMLPAPTPRPVTLCSSPSCPAAVRDGGL